MNWPVQSIMSMLEWNAAEWHTGSSPSCTYIIVFFFFFLKRHNLVLRVLDADFFYFYEKSCVSRRQVWKCICSVFLLKWCVDRSCGSKCQKEKAEGQVTKYFIKSYICHGNRLVLATLITYYLNVQVITCWNLPLVFIALQWVFVALVLSRFQTGAAVRKATPFIRAFRLLSCYYPCILWTLQGICRTACTGVL